MKSTSERQPVRVTRMPKSGRKISWPVALLAVRMPITVPRFVSNQRLTIVAPATRLMLPAPMPTMPPHSSKNCHEYAGRKRSDETE